MAYLSELSVYRILNDANLLARWKRHRSSGTAPTNPRAPPRAVAHELDVFADRGQLVFPGDGARCVQPLRGALRVADDDDSGGRVARNPTGDGADGRQAGHRDGQRLAVHRGLVQRSCTALRAGAHSDSDVSSGIERAGGAVSPLDRRGAGRPGAPRISRQARRILGKWVWHYNEERLHTGLCYLTPGAAESRITRRGVTNRVR